MNRGVFPGTKQYPQPVPPGVVWETASSTLPDPQIWGIWVWCDGTAYDRGQYAALFKEIGTNYGAGDGNKTFNVPDKRGRTGIGAGTGTGGGSAGAQGTAPSGGSALTARSVGAWTGEETHALTSAEMTNHDHGLANHSHNASSTGEASLHTHSHTHNGGATGGDIGNHGHGAEVISGTASHTHVSANGQYCGVPSAGAAFGGGNTSGINASHSHSLGGNDATASSGHVHNLAGQGSAASTSTGHNTVQPSTVFNYMIKC